jgi:hypothetical protein
MMKKAFLLIPPLAFILFAFQTQTKPALSVFTFPLKDTLLVGMDNEISVIENGKSTTAYVVWLGDSLNSLSVQNGKYISRWMGVPAGGYATLTVKNKDMAVLFTKKLVVSRLTHAMTPRIKKIYDDREARQNAQKK